VTRRVVHILHHSPSLLHDQPLDRILGASQWHLETARWQARFLRDVSIECWTPERKLDRPRSTELHGIPHHLFPSLAIGYQREVSFAILRALDGLDPANTTVFLHGSVSWFSSVLLLRAGERLRFVLQNHGEATAERRYAHRRGPRPIDWRTRRFFERRALPRAHTIFYLNEENLADYLACGVPEEKLVWSPMGVDLDVFHPLAESRAVVRSSLGLPPDRRCIGFVGRLSHEKRVELLLGAMEHLTDATLVIVGDGPLRSEFEARAAGRANLFFVGRVSEPERLARFYNAFDVTALPSSSEGLPVVLVESLASGTPVLASDLAGTRRILGDAGHFIRSTDAEGLAGELRAAIDGVPARDSLRERASPFSWRTICERHAAVLAG
jgi:glycosyltransferase involved in cell wall biosynthesis